MKIKDEILRLYLNGKKPKEIAEILNTSLSYVSMVLSSIRKVERSEKKLSNSLVDYINTVRNERLQKLTMKYADKLVDLIRDTIHSLIDEEALVIDRFGNKDFDNEKNFNEDFNEGLTNEKGGEFFFTLIDKMKNNVKDGVLCGAVKTVKEIKKEFDMIREGKSLSKNLILNSNKASVNVLDSLDSIDSLNKNLSNKEANDILDGGLSEVENSNSKCISNDNIESNDNNETINDNLNSSSKINNPENELDSERSKLIRSKVELLKKMLSLTADVKDEEKRNEIIEQIRSEIKDIDNKIKQIDKSEEEEVTSNGNVNDNNGFNQNVNNNNNNNFIKSVENKRIENKKIVEKVNKNELLPNTNRIGDVIKDVIGEIENKVESKAIVKNNGEIKSIDSNDIVIYKRKKNENEGKSNEQIRRDTAYKLYMIFHERAKTEPSKSKRDMEIKMMYDLLADYTFEDILGAMNDFFRHEDIQFWNIPFFYKRRYFYLAMKKDRETVKEILNAINTELSASYVLDGKIETKILQLLQQGFTKQDFIIACRKLKLKYFESNRRHTNGYRMTSASLNISFLLDRFQDILNYKPETVLNIQSSLEEDKIKDLEMDLIAKLSELESGEEQ